MKTRYLSSNWVLAVLAIAIGLSCRFDLHAQSHTLRYEVDVSWPKPLPDRWIIGGLGGVCVDAQNHVLILNRQDLLAGCGKIL